MDCKIMSIATDQLNFPKHRTLIRIIKNLTSFLLVVMFAEEKVESRSDAHYQGLKGSLTRNLFCTSMWQYAPVKYRKNVLFFGKNWNNLLTST